MAAARRFWMRSQREAVFRRYIVPDAHFLKAFAKAAIERLVVEHCYIGTGAQMVATRSCLSYSQKMFTSSASVCWLAQTKLGSLSCTSPVQSLQWKCAPAPAILKSNNVVTMAMASESAKSGPSRLPIDLRGKRAFIAGVADDNGYGWAIAKALAAAGAEILVGTWVLALNIFETSLRRGKFDESRLLPDGSVMEITKVYPLDAVFDSSEDIKSNKRYAGSSNWTVKEFDNRKWLNLSRMILEPLIFLCIHLPMDLRL